MTADEPTLMAAIRAMIREEIAAAQQAPDRLMSVEEAASLIGCSRSKAYEHIRHGRLRAHKDGRRTIVAASDVAAYIAEKVRQ